MTHISTSKATAVLNGPALIAQALPLATPSFTKRFTKDERGSTIMMFALLITPVFFMTGMAVDYSRMITTQKRMQTAIDAAALAGVRAQTASGAAAGTFQTAANAYYQAAVKPWVGSTSNSASTLTFTNYNSNTNTYTWTAESWLRTPFLSVMPSSANAGAPGECAVSKNRCVKVSATAAVIASPSGGNIGYSIETSLMLDITGSMSGQKIEDLKSATNSAIDILIWQDQSKQTSKIAMVPFAQDVRLPSASAFQIATGQAPANQNQTLGRTTFGKSSTEYCVVERTGANKYTDASPGSSNSYSMIEWVPVSNSSPAKCNVPAGAAIQPLTNNKTVLHNIVNGLTTAGGTAGQIGTAWAWYTLSPNFNALWDNDNRAKAYDTAYNINTKVGDASKVKLKKIAILMTDGDYNTEYEARGIDTGYFGAAPVNDTSQNQAAALCTGMKNAGIEVYTVGFSAPASNGSVMSQASKNFLKACATDDSHFYDASTGTALIAAFKDIALKISSIRIAQ